MKISTKGRYALALMLDLATNQNGSPIQIKEISERQGISNKYLEQIISSLNKAGYVRSVRGPQGGYLLVKKPEEYTVGMILRQTEGNMAPVSCLEFGEGDCPKHEDCVTLILWKKLDEAISNVIDSITLADLMQWKNEKENPELFESTSDNT